MKNKKVSSLLILLGLMALNFLIKGWFIAENSIASDEPFSIYHAQMDVLSIIRKLSSGNNPPLVEIILHYWIKLFGISALSVRFPSLIFGTLTVLYIYVLCDRFFNLRIALYSALIFIFSNYQIQLTHEARTYALIGMLTSAAMYYYLRLTTDDDGTWKHFTALILANVLLIYAHYFGFFILAVQFFHFLTNKSRIKKQGKYLLLAVGALLIAYSPNLIVFITRVLESSANGTWVKPPNGIYALYDMLVIFTNKLVVTLVVVVVLIAFGIKHVIKNRLTLSDSAL